MTARVDVEGLAAMLVKATPGPWEAEQANESDRRTESEWSIVAARDSMSHYSVADPDCGPLECDVRLIVALVNAAPALLAELTQLRAAREREREETIRECAAIAATEEREHRKALDELANVGTADRETMDLEAYAISTASQIRRKIERLAGGPASGQSVAVMEAVEAWGKARAKVKATRLLWVDGDDGYRARCEADDAASSAEFELRTVADRLAAGTGEGE